MDKAVEVTRRRQRGPPRDTDDSLDELDRPLQRVIELIEREPNQILITAHKTGIDFEELYETIERLKKLRRAAQIVLKARSAQLEQMMRAAKKKSRRGRLSITAQLHGMLDVLVRYLPSIGERPKFHYLRNPADPLKGIKDPQRIVRKKLRDPLKIVPQNRASRFVFEAVKLIAPDLSEQVPTAVREFTLAKLTGESRYRQRRPRKGKAAAAERK